MKDLLGWVGLAVVIAGFVMLFQDIADHIRALDGRPIPATHFAKR